MRPPPFRKAAIAAGLAGALAGGPTGAGAHPYNPENLPPIELERVQVVCQAVVGLSRGEAHFYACVDALSTVRARLGEGLVLQHAREQCAAGAAPADRIKLAECELGALQRATPVDDADAAPLARKASPSYFMISNREVAQREQQACAEIGVEPASPAFPECVHGLDTALFDADYPPP